MKIAAFAQLMEGFLNLAQAHDVFATYAPLVDRLEDLHRRAHFLLHDSCTVCDTAPAPVVAAAADSGAEAAANGMGTHHHAAVAQEEAAAAAQAENAEEAAEE